MSLQLDADLHGRLIVLAGLTDIRSDTLGRMLREHTVDHIWKCLRSGRPLVFSRPKGSVLALPSARAAQWGAEVRAADPVAAARAHQRAGVQVLVVEQPGYPPSLEVLDDAPGVLFVQGDASLLGEADPQSMNNRRAAIVGTRRATSYGRQNARALGRVLASSQVSVVSGLASGIDGSAHAGVIAERAPADARPIAVVGSGLDHVYPTANRGLWSDVREHGALVSEWPLGARPISWHFPLRNRVIVGLSEAVVVVESAITGGSMLTARRAAELGVPVLCVPGLITSPVSVGPHQMLAEGGSVCRGVDDVLVAMRVKDRNSASSKCTDHRRIPTTDGAAVLSGLGWDVLPVDRLLARFPGTSPGTLLLVLHELEFDGWVARGADGWFQLAAGQGRIR